MRHIRQVLTQPKRLRAGLCHLTNAPHHRTNALKSTRQPCCQAQRPPRGLSQAEPTPPVVLTWFIHRIHKVTIRDLEGIGLSEVRQETANVIKEIESHAFLSKTIDVDGVFGLGRTFWKFRQDA